MANNIPFWTENPNIIMNQEFITEFFPTTEMTFNQKLNAISRSIILMTIVVTMITRSIRVVVGAILTLGSIVLLHHYHKNQEEESFSNPALDTLKQNNKPIGDVFDTPTSSNPFSNVLITDYEDNPNKKPAPPLTGAKAYNDVLNNAKKLVDEANPDQPNVSDKLFHSVNEKLNFEQSLRPFHSTASTTIPNDQGAFAEFCYGSMKSCKEGNLFACARNTSHYNLY
jgi:Family of unknown function (DUF5762)